MQLTPRALYFIKDSTFNRSVSILLLNQFTQPLAPCNAKVQLKGFKLPKIIGVK
jgi:hypothetical protein